jgi:GNAT superfamily N-acetyltransferase
MKQTIRIVELENRDAGFWMQLGPLFASKEVRKEQPFFGDRGYTWLIAERGETLVGCAAVDSPKGTINHLYVMPEARGQTVNETLINAALQYLVNSGAKTVKAVERGELAKTLINHGFMPVGRRGSYSKLEFQSK